MIDTDRVTPVALPKLPDGSEPDARTVLFCAEPRLFQSAIEPLAAAGFKPTRAPSWADALSLYDGLRPSAVLVDGAFLDGAGPELCAALRRRSGRVAVPVLALCDGARDEARALTAGASDVVSRPLRWDRIVLRLSHLWREYRSGLEVERLRLHLNDAHREMARTREEAERATRVDAMTGLPNRTRLVEIVQRALGRSQRLEGRVALMCVDIDRFGAVNETLGRANGDRALREFAERIGQLSRAVDARGTGSVVITAARLEGDEFTLVFTDIVDTGFLSKFAERMLETIARPIAMGDASISLSASVGIAVAAGDSGSAEVFLQHGETAAVASSSTARRSPARPASSWACTAACAPLSTRISSRWPTSRCSMRRAGTCAASRRSCAGRTRRTAGCRPPSSCRSRRRPG
jgi:diguanylate cyclase (GGDEF)-like protein